MITLLEKYETQRRLLKVRLCPGLVLHPYYCTNRVNKHRWRYGSKDAYNNDKLS